MYRFERTDPDAKFGDRIQDDDYRNTVNFGSNIEDKDYRNQNIGGKDKDYRNYDSSQVYNRYWLSLIHI